MQTDSDSEPEYGPEAALFEEPFPDFDVNTTPFEKFEIFELETKVSFKIVRTAIFQNINFDGHFTFQIYHLKSKCRSLE